MSEEIAKRLEKALPPGLQENKGQPELPPEIAQQLQQSQQQIQQLSGALEKAAAHADELESDSEMKLKELLVKAYDAETKRLQVVGTAMQPEQIQALVMQTVQQLLTTPSPSAGIQEDYQEYEQKEYGQPMAVMPSETQPPMG
jgi:hypothetical protein